ncbi:allene oxide cyclase barrel-like domain-containing protein [Enterobacter ludwigii]|uniref:allene oxide cyclase barrel-like domain-containing protein n=1 Tax=Enterobacter ludwigii TaxID=299767 RepID=UPI003BEED1CD
MNRKKTAIGALFVAGGLLCTAMAQSQSGETMPSHQSKTPRRDETHIITLADGTRGEKRAVDTGNDGVSQGDLFVFEQPLMDQHRRDIGTNSGYCVTTKSGVHGQCQWTLKVDDGSVIVAGQEAESGKSILAVIGTTGKFSGFTGEMSSRPNGDGTFTQELTLFRP